MAMTIPLAKPHYSKAVTVWFAGHWMPIFLGIIGIWVWTPWLAPIFMYIGWERAGNLIYWIYQFFCHQLPERSFFFFGSKPMYSLSEIQAVWHSGLNPLQLRKFIGNPVMGWKLAWSDRMVSFFNSIWLFGVIYWPLRRKIKGLPVWAFILLLLPMALDGGTHFISDLAGVERGFREANQWLAVLTNNTLPISFYAGNALGSFNSWMRLITGILAGFGIAWFAFPLIYRSMELDQELKKVDYGKILEQIRNKDSRAPGG